MGLQEHKQEAKVKARKERDKPCTSVNRTIGSDEKKLE